jgi:hypothetical protein
LLGQMLTDTMRFDKNQRITTRQPIRPAPDGCVDLTLGPEEAAVIVRK